MLHRSVLFAAIFLGAASSQAQSIVLRYKFHPGQSHRYSMDMELQMGMGAGQAMQMGSSSVTKQSVVKVDPDGGATLSVVVQSQTTTMNGKPLGMGTGKVGQTSTVHISPTGRTSGLKIAGSEGMGMGLGLEQLQGGSMLPDGPTRVGGRWTTTFSGSAMSGLKIQNQLASVTHKGGVTIAQIHSTGSLDMGKLLGKVSKQPGLSGSGIMNLTVDSTFNLTTGVMEKVVTSGVYTMEMNVKGSSSASPMHMKGTEKMTIKLLD